MTDPRLGRIGWGILHQQGFGRLSFFTVCFSLTINDAEIRSRFTVCKILLKSIFFVYFILKIKCSALYDRFPRKQKRYFSAFFIIALTVTLRLEIFFRTTMGLTFFSFYGIIFSKDWALVTGFFPLLTSACKVRGVLNLLLCNILLF